MNLIKWAKRWAIPEKALAELAELSGADFTPKTVAGLSETAVQNKVRLAAAKNNVRLWRNNVGAFDPANPPNPGFRWGLCNDSKKLNAKLKSSDLIGIAPVIITEEMVGLTVGVFTARECKPEGWSYKGSPREQAQLNYINLINLLGGDASFTTGAE